MHVKLEVETQPLSNFVVAVRNKLRKLFIWMAVLSVSAAAIYFIHELVFWALTKYSAAKHLSGLEDIPPLAWVITILILICSVCGFYSMVSDARQEARWRSS